MILGSKFIDKMVVISLLEKYLFYTSEDGEKWSYKNRCYDDTIGDMWECPDLFEVDGEICFSYVSREHLISRWILITLITTVYSIVGFDEESCDMKIDR